MVVNEGVAQKYYCIIYPLSCVQMPQTALNSRTDLNDEAGQAGHGVHHKIQERQAQR